MRKSKVIPLQVGEKKEVTVKEVSPYAAYKAMLAEDKAGEILAMAENCIDLSREELQGLYGSEIEQIVDAFLEVNGSFLAIADKFGVKQALQEAAVKMLAGVPMIADELLTNLPAVFSTSFREVMDKMPGTTDGQPSSSPSKPSLVKKGSK